MKHSWFIMLYLFLILATPMTCGTLAAPSGTEPAPPALAHTPSRWKWGRTGARTCRGLTSPGISQLWEVWYESKLLRADWQSGTITEQPHGSRCRVHRRPGGDRAPAWLHHPGWIFGRYHLILCCPPLLLPFYLSTIQFPKLFLSFPFFLPVWNLLFSSLM